MRGFRFIHEIHESALYVLLNGVTWNRRGSRWRDVLPTPNGIIKRYTSETSFHVKVVVIFSSIYFNMKWSSLGDSTSPFKLPQCKPKLQYSPSAAHGRVVMVCTQSYPFIQWHYTWKNDVTMQILIYSLWYLRILIDLCIQFETFYMLFILLKYILLLYIRQGIMSFRGTKRSDWWCRFANEPWSMCKV